MPAYRAPIRDIHFVAKELLGLDEHYARLQGCETLSDDLFDAIVDSGARFAENVLAPLNEVGDTQGCKFDNGEMGSIFGGAEDI